MQVIVANLIFDCNLPGPVHDFATWLDNRLFPLEVVLSELEEQKASPVDKDPLAARQPAVSS